jgi:hypothetical protein
LGGRPSFFGGLWPISFSNKRTRIAPLLGAVSRSTLIRGRRSGGTSPGTGDLLPAGRAAAEDATAALTALKQPQERAQQVGFRGEVG